MKIGFLFNHEQLHQIPHAITVAFELSLLSNDCEVTLLSSSPLQYEYINHYAEKYPGHKCQHRQLSLGPVARVLGKFLDRALPFTKLWILKSNLAVFAGLDALVIPEKTGLYLKSHLGLKNLQFIYTAHGAGDREIGFNRKLSEFDLVFLPGEKVRQRMTSAGILAHTQSRIVGYPKFDAVDAFTRDKNGLFDNDRLTVIYNPHFVPHLTSWYRMGMDILEYFYQSERYNLIFAPHVMLYARKMHISEESHRVSVVKKIPGRYRESENMIIDTGTLACIDMSYTLAADIYLGDVSSQVYEFLLHPRPCVFANAQNIEWESDLNYTSWRTGPVFSDVQSLDQSLEYAVNSHEDYSRIQQELFAETFDITAIPSSRRAAEAIIDFMGQA